MRFILGWWQLKRGGDVILSPAPYKTDLQSAGSSASASVKQKHFPETPKLFSSRFLMPAAVLGALLALAVVLQIFNGAYKSEFGAYPDEPAHYVTSLMVREYITGPHPALPLRFAEQYYHHYPKVAFGHWPPAFYIVQSIWMLLFSASRTSVRLEVAFTTALLAFSFWREAVRWFGKNAALLGAALLVCLPLVQNSTDEEMAESLLVLFCFWSTIYFSRFLESGKRSDSLWFGLYFSLTVLTKGSGWLLVFVPPIAILLTRKFRVLLESSFWLGVLLTAVLCLPWQIATLRSAERGWTGGDKPSIGYTFTALAKFVGILISIVGPFLSVLIAIGVGVLLWRCVRQPLESVPAAMLALLLGDWLFHSLVPAGVEDRKMILAVPALVYFLFAGGFWLTVQIHLGSRSRRWNRRALAALGAVIFGVTVFSIPRAHSYGYIAAAKYIVSDPELNKNRTLLVSSQSGGEGLLISEIAMRQPRPEDVVLRATKEFAIVDWTGEHYQSLFSTPAELLAFLDKHHVTAVVTDTYQGVTSFAHQQLLEQTIRDNANRFQLAAEFPGHSNTDSGKVEVYRVRAPVRPD